MSSGIDKHNAVHAMKLWKDRVESELNSAAEWEENWGFLKAEKKEPEVEDLSVKETVPAEKMPEQVKLNKSFAVDNEADGEKNDPTDVVELNSKLRYTLNRTKLPKEKFSRPQATSHELGWRPNIELFGVGQHGIRRNQELWPEM